VLDVRCLFYALATCSTLALSQTTPEYLGRWLGKAVSPVTGAELVSELVLAESGSTWTYTRPTGSPGRDNPCFTKAFPVTVIADAAPELKLQVDGSKAFPGCPDFVVVLKHVDENTYEAQFGDGKRLKLSRSQ
jgi:hypothetical protein